jgi:hypothetical protein
MNEEETINSMHNTEMESLRLVRSRSNSSSFSGTGYLFLAIVFCMMCCSSLLVYPSKLISQIRTIAPNAKFGPSMNGHPSFTSSRQLKSTGDINAEAAV